MKSCLNLHRDISFRSAIPLKGGRSAFLPSRPRGAALAYRVAAARDPVLLRIPSRRSLALICVIMAIAAHRSHSAGLLIYRQRECGLEILLVRPGGPWWGHRDQGAWQIPKGQIEPDENAKAAAFREAREELGVELTGDAAPLGSIRQAGGKRVDVWALEQEVDPAAVHSNRFELEWPPKSGKVKSFPEIEEARWFGLAEARSMILPSQAALLDAIGKLQPGAH